MDYSENGQVFTPDALACELASWVTLTNFQKIRAIDLGAGMGALSEAFTAQVTAASKSAEMQMVEVDPLLARHLAQDAPNWGGKELVKYSVINADLIKIWPTLADGERFTHVIMNPPYARVEARSSMQKMLRQRRVSVSNLYGAFLWIGATILEEGGELLAIVPRSFCNGPSFRALRTHLLEHVTVTRIHHFTDRRGVFGRDKVQQEVLLMKFTRTARKSTSTVLVSQSRSIDDLGGDPTTVPFDEVVVMQPDGDCVIAIPTKSTGGVVAIQRRPLLEEGESASTGSVVDFRVPELTVESGSKRVPLIEAHDLAPVQPAKRPRRFLPCDEKLRKYIYPPGDYVVVARFSPREQEPRLRARVVTYEETLEYGGIAFENHVNVIHREKRGLGRVRAEQIINHLSHPDTDNQFSMVSGTTHVNVADLRRLMIVNDDLLDIQNRLF